jgi:hypothetical protein
MISYACRRLATAGAVIALAAVASGAGLAAANASPAAPAHSGTEHFYLMTTQRTAAKYEIIATGVFTDSGTDISGSKVDTAKLAKGSFKVNHAGAFHILKERLNPATCFAVFEAKAGLTLGGGTGAYKGISGSGTATISEIAIFSRSKGKCNPNGTPVSNEETITATAHVKL